MGYITVVINQSRMTIYQQQNEEFSAVLISNFAWINTSHGLKKVIYVILLTVLLIAETLCRINLLLAYPGPLGQSRTYRLVFCSAELRMLV